MKILGIGNAIVDVICKVEDNFLSEKLCDQIIQENKSSLIF